MKRRRRVMWRSRRRRQRRIRRGTIRHRVARLMMLYRGHHRTEIVGVICEADRTAEVTDATRNPRGGCHLVLGPEPEPV